jgi:hypothetical protein
VHATSISGHTRWEGLESPFLFARLRTTDDESQACQDETRLRELGTVRVGIPTRHLPPSPLHLTRLTDIGADRVGGGRPTGAVAPHVDPHLVDATHTRTIQESLCALHISRRRRHLPSQELVLHDPTSTGGTDGVCVQVRPVR